MPVPRAKVVREPEIAAASMSGAERAMLIAVAIVLLALFAVAVILPHLPSTAEGW